MMTHMLILMPGIEYANGAISTRHRFNAAKQELTNMGGKTQLLMFTTGPGGSGKSRIIDAVSCDMLCKTFLRQS